MNQENEKLIFLIVDDDQVDREAIKRYLKKSYPSNELEILEADSGASALTLLKSNTFACVFLDYLLPDMDGIALLKLLYNPESDLAHSPFVMLTGQGNEAVMLEALRSGAQDYIRKQNLSGDILSIAIAKAREVFELKRLRNTMELQLQHTRRMEIIGQLTSGIAHDFNNLLTVVLGNTRLLRRRIESKPDEFSLDDADKKLQSIEKAAHKGAELVRRLMIFTRQSVLAQKKLDICESVEETFKLLKRTIGETIVIKITKGENVWPIFIDEQEFENVLINLAVNARDSMPKGGNITIDIRNIIFDDTQYKDNQEVIAGDYVLTSITDQGSGMDEETKKRLFEPFFTTKPVGEGTGLGLSMVYGFIQQSKGYVFVESELGAGTTFRIYLPRALEGIESNSNLASAVDRKSVQNAH